MTIVYNVLSFLWGAAVHAAAAEASGGGFGRSRVERTSQEGRLRKRSESSHARTMTTGELYARGW